MSTNPIKSLSRKAGSNPASSTTTPTLSILLKLKKQGLDKISLIDFFNQVFHVFFQKQCLSVRDVTGSIRKKL